jgi:hypothetical protein
MKLTKLQEEILQSISKGEVSEDGKHLLVSPYRAPVLGLVGRKRSGKSTVASMMTTAIKTLQIGDRAPWRSPHSKELSFAAPLKQIAICCGFEADHVHERGALSKEDIDPILGISPREFLQKIGTEVFRDQLKDLFPNWKLNESLWVHMMRKRIKRFIEENPARTLIISDCRFPDEMALIREFGGALIHIERDEPTGTGAYDAEARAHSSESFIDKKDCDYHIKNNKGIADLVYEVVKILEHVDFRNGPFTMPAHM